MMKDEDAGYLSPAHMWEDDLKKARKRIAELEAEPFREEFSFTKPFQELAKEFRRLAAEAEDTASDPPHLRAEDAFRQAAQMLEERLNPYNA